MATEILDKIKEAFKKLSGESESTSKSSDALLSALREMDSVYRAKKTNVDVTDTSDWYPETLGLEPKTYVEKTDEQIEEEARQMALEKNEKSLKSAEEAYSVAENKASELTSDVEISETEAYKELKDNAESAITKHRNDMVFQGLVNSSINTYGEEAIAEEISESYQKIKSEYDKKYTKIKNDLSEAEQKYQNAIRAYDLSYAVDLRETIDKLKQQELKRIADINEYNIEIAEKEAKYQAQRLKALESLRKERTEALLKEIATEAEHEEQYGATPEKQAEYDKRYSIARSYYNGFSKTDANLMVYGAHDELVALIGKENYLKLVNEQINREQEEAK